MTETATRSLVHIITYHNSYSYGACLQAFASQKIFENLGFQVRFVDYHNAHEDDSIGKSAWSLLAEGELKKALSTGLRNILGYKRYALKAFANYHSTVPKTSICSRALSDFSDLESDLLVVGSDQMWNASISGGLDPAFLLDFGCAANRVSLATSMGNYKFTQEEGELVRRCLGRFSAISVREQHAKDQIDVLTGRDSFICLDPTLLLSSWEWRAFARKPKGIAEGENFLLVFTIDNRPERASCVWEYCSRKLNMPVYRIANNYIPVSGVDRTLRGITPQEFVWLIDHAAYVVTDSFHGTAFSLNLETPFTVIPNKQGNNNRMTDLLESLNLMNRFSPVAGDHINLDMSFSNARASLAQKRDACIAWVMQAASSESV